MEAYAAALPDNSPATRPGAQAANGPGPGALRDSFRANLGYPAPRFLGQASVRMEKVGEDATATYSRCWIQATPEMETYGLYIVPRRTRAPTPLVIAVHGGGGFPELATFNGGSNYNDMVRGSVGEGYVTFAPLAVMYPYVDRDHGTPIPPDVRGRIGARLEEGGTTLMGVEVTKIARALDALEKRPEVDARRVAMIGLSYGGFYTLYAAAVDSRIRAAVASCSFRDRGPGAPPVIPELRETNMLGSADLAGLISPRALQVQCGIGDELFPIEFARRAAVEARSHYPGALASAFDFQAFDGGHEFRGDVAWKFLRREFGRMD